MFFRRFSVAVGHQLFFGGCPARGAFFRVGFAPARGASVGSVADVAKGRAAVGALLRARFEFCAAVSALFVGKM